MKSEIVRLSGCPHVRCPRYAPNQKNYRCSKYEDVSAKQGKISSSRSRYLAFSFDNFTLRYNIHSKQIGMGIEYLQANEYKILLQLFTHDLNRRSKFSEKAAIHFTNVKNLQISLNRRLVFNCYVRFACQQVRCIKWQALWQVLSQILCAAPHAPMKCTYDWWYERWKHKVGRLVKR